MEAAPWLEIFLDIVEFMLPSSSPRKIRLSNCPCSRGEPERSQIQLPIYFAMKIEILYIFSHLCTDAGGLPYHFVALLGLLFIVFAQTKRMLLFLFSK